MFFLLMLPPFLRCSSSSAASSPSSPCPSSTAASAIAWRSSAGGPPPLLASALRSLGLLSFLLFCFLLFWSLGLLRCVTYHLNPWSSVFLIIWGLGLRPFLCFDPHWSGVFLIIPPCFYQVLFRSFAYMILPLVSWIFPRFLQSWPFEITLSCSQPLIIVITIITENITISP